MAISRSGGQISLTVDSRKVQTMIGGYIKTIPKGADIGAKKVAGAYAKAYLEEMSKAKSTSRINPRGIKSWTGRSFNILRSQIKEPIKFGPGNYGVVAPDTLIVLDQMRPHVVALKKGRSISRWARTKLGLEGFVTSHITVSPHPWIVNANKRARKNIQKVRKEIRKTVNRRGR